LILALVILACFVVALGLSVVLVPNPTRHRGTRRAREADDLPAEDIERPDG
jgi:hypothetical protein